ncbi:MAG: hypothetical protein OXB84_00940, partial [Halobacteriovoraceae bacterium]|nr:hypothetical protein [Halobacteriovoraceae bacterium]
DCRVLLQLRHKTNLSFRLPVAFQCPRDVVQGYFIVIGFDLSALHTPKDPDLIKNWLEQMTRSIK